MGAVAKEECLRVGISTVCSRRHEDGERRLQFVTLCSEWNGERFAKEVTRDVNE